MTDLVIRSSNREDGHVCFAIGCRNPVATKEDGTTASRCQQHLEKQAANQKSYRRRVSDRLSTDKQQVAQLEAEKRQLLKQLQEAQVKAKLYDEVKHRYDTLKLAYANNVTQK